MAEKPSVTIIWPGAATLMQEINQSLLPAKLKQLFRKGHFNANQQTYEHQLVDLFSIKIHSKADLPIALLRNPGQLSLCADPCYLHADRDRLLLFPINDLTMEEAYQLIHYIQPLLDDFAAQLIINDENHWSILMKKMPEIELTALSSLIGKSVVSALPLGADQNDWLRLGNEIQMALFDHPLNQQRQADGKLPVNSLWFWGIADWQPKKNAWHQVYGDDPILTSLSAATSTSLQSLSQWNKTRPVGKLLVVFPHLNLQTDWQQPLEQINSTLMPLMQKLRRYQLSQLTLIIPEYGQYHWRCWDAWKIW